MNKHDTNLRKKIFVKHNAIKYNRDFFLNIDIKFIYYPHVWDIVMYLCKKLKC